MAKKNKEYVYGGNSSRNRRDHRHMEKTHRRQLQKPRRPRQPHDPAKWEKKKQLKFEKRLLEEEKRKTIKGLFIYLLSILGRD